MKGPESIKSEQKNPAEKIPERDKKYQDIVFPEGVGSLNKEDVVTVHGKHEGEFTLKGVYNTENGESLYFVNDKGEDFQVLRKKGSVSTGEERFQTGDIKIINDVIDVKRGSKKSKTEGKDEEGVDAGDGNKEKKTSGAGEKSEKKEGKEKSAESILEEKRDDLAFEYSRLKEKHSGILLRGGVSDKYKKSGEYKDYERIGKDVAGKKIIKGKLLGSTTETGLGGSYEIAHLENEYRDSLRAYRKELFEKGLDGAEEIIEKTVVNEAIEFNNLKNDYRLKKYDWFEKTKALAGKAVEGYTRMPKKYKYALSAVLFGSGALATSVGGAVGTAVLTGVVTGRGIQRVFSTAATAVGVEAWRKGKQEKQDKKQASDAFGGFTKEALSKKLEKNVEGEKNLGKNLNAKLDKMLFELESSKKGKKYGRFALAGTAGALMFSGVVGDVIGKGFGLGKELLGFGEVDAPVPPETVEVKPNVPSEVSDTLPENPDGPIIVAGGGLKEEYDTNKRDPFEPFKEDVPEPVLNENTIVKPGDGIERILQRQLEDSPEKFGYTGDLKDSVAIAKWADGESHSLAIKNNFFDKDTGREIHLRYDKDNPVNYVLKENGFIDRINSVGHEYEHNGFRDGISESVVGVASESAGEGDPVPYHGTLDGESVPVEESATLETEKTVAPMTITENPNAEGVNLKNEITVTSGDDEMVVRVFGEEGESHLVNEPGSNAMVESTIADEARIYDKDGKLLGVVDGDVGGLSAEEIAQKAQVQMDQIREVEAGKIESESEAEAKIIEEKEVIEQAKAERFEAGKAIRTSYPHFSMDTTDIILDLNEYTSGTFTPEVLAQQFDTVIGNEPDKFFDGARLLVDDNNNVKIEFTHKANLGTVDMLFNGTDGTIAVDGFGGENLNAKVATPHSFAEAFRFVSSGAASRDSLNKAIMEQEARDEVVGGIKSFGRGIKNVFNFLLRRK